MSKGGIASGFAFGYDPTGRSVIFKIDRIPYFDIRYSIFDIHYSIFAFFRVSFSIRPAAAQASGSAKP
jgi:hypothetical protein